ncbi:Telomere repeat-binding protein 6 [Senna tora]|uniref:Telomere repeat-binding protein 6 n=1 Tax=Senna tora TaxID=362788 RepID=A0A834W8B0_9FABA|nr:Telomere repeat-binding protein 6 [Senna tora]
MREVSLSNSSPQKAACTITHAHGRLQLGPSLNRSHSVKILTVAAAATEWTRSSATFSGSDSMNAFILIGLCTGGACGFSMEILAGIEDNDEGKLEDSGVDRSSSGLSSPKQIANPVVYKLVRVEGDGRLVPATDDEVIEVEDFLEYDQIEMGVDADTGHSEGCTSIDRSSSGKLQFECSEGVSQPDTAEADLGKLNARLQMLQKVKQEEKLRLACGSPGLSCVNFDGQCSDAELLIMDGTIQSVTPFEEIVPSLAPALNNSHSNQLQTIGECSRPSEGHLESGSSTSAVYSTLKPDFLILEGEICLDKLSIRELHELFKVTFGRETTVKDKQWLKRRIAMSLTNSCDVSATTFVVQDNRIIKKYEEDSHGNVNAVLFDDTSAGEEDINCKDSSTAEGTGFEENQVVFGKTLRNHFVEHDLGCENLQIEQRAAKRIRKPTKRYIEELSENESRDPNPRLLNSNKNMGLGHVPPNSYVGPARNVFSEGRTVTTRFDSLGGSGVYIPCVCRVRRSRPRKNIMPLMNFHPSGRMVEDAKVSSKALGEHGSQADNESWDKVLKSRLAPAKFQQQSTVELGKYKQCPVMDTIELQEELRASKADLPSYTSDGNIVAVPTAKGGMRRKHHRAWTLVEVMKLVEGVSQCGAGRWSEIKRLAFASYSYRTSVDLKDKWRNLLKASFAHTPADEGMNSRKHGTVAIPEPILLRVRELAEMNSQVPTNFSSSKPTGGARIAQDDRSGYL